MTSQARQKCLVLGGKGFIGSHLVDALVARGHPVRVFDRAGLPFLGDAAALKDVEWFDGDFTSEADVAAALDGCGVCFHLISTTLPKSSNDDPVFDVESNVIGSVRLLQHAARRKLRKVIYVSSGGTVYGTPRSLPMDETHPTDPICSYGIAKLAVEKYLHLFHLMHGLDYTILRPSNPFGERQRTQASQGAVAIFMGRALRGEPIDIWGDGSAVRDYVYIGDMARALVAAMDHDGPERVFNVGTGVGVTLNQVLDGIETVTGRALRRNYKPGRAVDVPVNTLSVERARRALKWEPATPFMEGLARMAKWLMAQPADGR